MRGFRNILSLDRPEHHSTDCLKDCLLVALRPSNMLAYLRDGSVRTSVRAATLIEVGERERESGGGGGGGRREEGRGGREIERERGGGGWDGYVRVSTGRDKTYANYTCSDDTGWQKHGGQKCLASCTSGTKLTVTSR